MSKSEFIRSLQGDNVTLTPYEVSQRIRKRHACCSRYRGDPGLNIEEYRGYMVRYVKPDRTPEDPEWYECIISLQQSKQWQDLVWIKEILGILDGPNHWTSNKELLGHMLDHRGGAPRSTGTPLNVTADSNGLILALGCAIPLGYRKTLREQRAVAKYTPQQLEAMILIPAEFVETVLNPAFEEDFERALRESDREEGS